MTTEQIEIEAMKSPIDERTHLVEFLISPARYTGATHDTHVVIPREVPLSFRAQPRNLAFACHQR